MKSISLYYVIILVLMLAACSAPLSTSQPVTPTAQPVNQTEAAGHVPVILRIVERTEEENGQLFLHEDITFTDADGDATKVVDTLISSNQPVSVSNTDILASSDEQIGEATVTDTWGCASGLVLVVDSRILDRAGNLSEPEVITITCPVEQPPSILPFLTMMLAIGLFLLGGSWMMFRAHTFELRSSLKSILLLFFSLFPVYFLYLIFHEGGHALLYLIRGGTVTILYAHPFSFAGYVRPLFDWENFWMHAAGAAVVIPVSLLIFILCWKRRSVSFLPLVMFFPWAAMLQGIAIMLVEGDFQNIVRLTGLPPLLFTIMGFLIMVIGFFFFVSLFPLLGLAPQDRKSLFVLPASIFLWSLVGGMTAFLFVPGSPIDTQFFLAREIILSANMFPITGVIIGLLLAGIYLTLYRRVSHKLPPGLRTETVTLTWQDLRIPGLLFTISLILGLMIIL